MACDPFEALLDRALARTKSGDTMLAMDRPTEYEIKISRTATGISIDQVEWYPVMGSRAWTEIYDGDAARDKLRQWYGNPDNEGRLALEARFPEIDPEAD